MEIKILSIEIKEDNELCTLTTIVEAYNIAHFLKHYSSKEDFWKQTNADLKTFRILGVPKEFYDKTYTESLTGQFLLINYDDSDGANNDIICMDCEVYITNKGQTIDKVIVN